MSQTMALGILIEVLEFRRPRYLLLLVLGLLLSYGTGIGMLLVSLPIATLVDRKAQLPALLISFFASGLLGDRTDRSISVHGAHWRVRGGPCQRLSSLIAPFWMAPEHFDTVSLPALLGGYGPGTADSFTPRPHVRLRTG